MSVVLTQDPEGEPLMLDRFDARWMLDLSDFSKGTGSALPAKLEAEVRQPYDCITLFVSFCRMHECVPFFVFIFVRDKMIKLV